MGTVAGPGVAIGAGRVVEPVSCENKGLTQRLHGSVAEVVVAIQAKISLGCGRRRGKCEQRECAKDAHGSNIARFSWPRTPVEAGKWGYYNIRYNGFGETKLHNLWCRNGVLRASERYAQEGVRGTGCGWTYNICYNSPGKTDLHKTWCRDGVLRAGAGDMLKGK